MKLDVIGGGYQADLPPSAMAEMMANPELKKQLITWPNFMTYYLFFDTWNKPFDNLKVRQAFSHAIDRDKLINGPLQYQAAAAYTMNPPGFPGESVEKLKSVQNYDPEAGGQAVAEAGFPGGKGFPKLTLYLRHADPALTNAAEAIAGMFKENLGVEVEVQNLDYSIYTEKMRNQKKNKGGDFIFAMVPYEFDFVDGSNMLSVWGGCEKAGTDKSAARAATPGTTRTSTSCCATPARSSATRPSATRCTSRPRRSWSRTWRWCRSTTASSTPWSSPTSRADVRARPNGTVTWRFRIASPAKSLIYHANR